MKGFKKVLAMLLAVSMVAAMVMGCSSNSGDAEEEKTEESTEAEAPAEEEESGSDEVLKGGGSNIIYVITPSVSNPAFKAEADTATAKAKELGYEVKAASHDDEIGRAHV